jgi:predicted ATPase
MLIVFDNCEHVIEAVSEISEAILQGAPEVHILATSREPLRAIGERVQRIVPLAVPPVSTKLTAAEVLRFPAVQPAVPSGFGVMTARWNGHSS